MNKKQIYIAVGVLAVAGIIYYFYNKNKTTSKTTDVKETKEDSTNLKEATIENVQEYKQEKKDIKEICGKKPALFMKKEIIDKYNECIAKNSSSFMGDFDEFMSDFDID
jgi:hypothetical protein